MAGRSSKSIRDVVFCVVVEVVIAGGIFIGSVGSSFASSAGRDVLMEGGGDVPGTPRSLRTLKGRENDVDGDNNDGETGMGVAGEKKHPAGMAEALWDMLSVFCVRQLVAKRPPFWRLPPNGHTFSTQ